MCFAIIVSSGVDGILLLPPQNRSLFDYLLIPSMQVVSLQTQLNAHCILLLINETFCLFVNLDKSNRMNLRRKNKKWLTMLLVRYGGFGSLSFGGS